MEKYSRSGLVKLLNGIFVIVALSALISLIFEYGFYLSPDQEFYIVLLDLGIIFYFIPYSILKLSLAKDRYSYLKTHWFNYTIIILVMIEIIVFLGFSGVPFLSPILSGRKFVQISKLYIVGFQISIILSIIAQSLSINQKIANFRFNPAQVLLFSFLVIILLGSGFLSLPRAVTPGTCLSYVDALFTATSATCVTGLTVLDTGQQFSMTGQLIILVLIQIGALGIMTYASFFAFILGKNISLRERLLMRDVMNYENMGVISRLLSATVIFTLVIEALGALFLFIGMQDSAPQLGMRIYSAIFHSISAFCNAGFSLYSNSFMNFTGNYMVVTTLSLLIILGGLGFPVILNLLTLRGLAKFRQGKLFSVQTRMVLGISFFLIFFGFLFFLLTENRNSLNDLAWPEKILHAFFQSVTTRTAGFNTVNIGQIAPVTSLLFILLMFIGASPGSTGGGIKTTTAGILFAGVWSVIRGRNRIELFKKDIPFTVLNRSIVIFIFSVLLIFMALMVLSYSEQASLLDISFETVSAFGTVGLSRGLTSLLTDTGKITVILLMFFGRLGALTISLAITSPKEVYHYGYPSENVMVG